MASDQEEEVLGKAYDGRLMRRLLTYLRPYKWHVVVALAAIVLKSGLDVLGPFLTKIAIDKYLAKSPNSHSWIGDRLSSAPLVGIAQIGGLYVGILIFTFALEFIQTYLMQWTGQKVMFDLRSQIFRHLQHMHVAFFDKNPVGRLVTRVTTDVDALNEMFTAGVVSIFEDVFVLAGIIAIMMKMNCTPPRSSATKCAIPTAASARRSRGSTLTCRKRSRECWSCSFSIARSAPSINFPTSTPRTWRPSKTPSWPTRCITRWLKYFRRWPLRASSGGAGMT
jgi:ABC-type multidrug transport system fused ATPase/permease subunit